MFKKLSYGFVGPTSTRRGMKVAMVVEEVEATTQTAMESLEAFSSINLDKVLKTKERISELAHFIKDQNQQLYEVVSYATEGAQRHANNITEILMSMQIQDIIKQRLEKVIQLIQEVQDQLNYCHQPIVDSRSSDSI